MLELKHRLISTTTLLILDVLWITLFMGPRYKVMIKNIQGSELKVFNTPEPGEPGPCLN